MLEDSILTIVFLAHVSIFPNDYILLSTVHYQFNFATNHRTFHIYTTKTLFPQQDMNQMIKES